MKKISLSVLLIGLVLLPQLASAQHSMKTQAADPNLEARENFHAESLYHVPAEWTNQDAERVRLADFKGQPLMVVMFYGKCTGTCPVLIQRTWKLYSQLDKAVRDELQVLAVSFDTKNDTPAALKAYAEYEKLDIPGWSFVTGRDADIRELAMLLGVQYRERSDGHYEHSNLISVLDKQGRIAIRSEGITGDLTGTASAIEKLFKADIQ